MINYFQELMTDEQCDYLKYETIMENAELADLLQIPGLTQEQMAEKLRITGRAYSDLERGIYCFSAVALVFLLLMLEEGEIKELLSSLRDEIEKVESREVA